MAYLCREERRELIMNAVVDIVSREGLASATVRRIAQELSCSPGQIHHHFASAETLRAEAVREVWRRIEPSLTAQLHQLAPRERLLSILAGCCMQLGHEMQPIMEVAERLWKEAWNIRSEPAVREAIAFGLGEMTNEVTSSLREGIEAGIFPATTEVNPVALRLISAAQGFDMMDEIGAVERLGGDRASFFEALLRLEGL